MPLCCHLPTLPLQLSTAVWFICCHTIQFPCIHSISIQLKKHWKQKVKDWGYLSNSPLFVFMIVSEPDLNNHQAKMSLFCLSLYWVWVYFECSYSEYPWAINFEMSTFFFISKLRILVSFCLLSHPTMNIAAGLPISVSCIVLNRDIARSRHLLLCLKICRI